MASAPPASMAMARDGASPKRRPPPSHAEAAVAACWPVGHVLGLRGASGFGSSTTADDVLRELGVAAAEGVAVVTGGNGALGRETGRALANAGMHVVLACRSAARGEDAAQAIRADVPGALVTACVLDLADLDSVRQCAAGIAGRQLGPVRVVVCNGGLMPPKEHASVRMANGEDVEITLAVNYVGHALLVHLLTPGLKAGARAYGDARVVHVSSAVHRLHGVADVAEFGARCSPLRAYARSKLAMVLHANALARQFAGEALPLRVLAVHPGGVDTAGARDSATGQGAAGAVLRTLGKPFVKSVPQGGASIVWACVARGAPNGAYVANCNVCAPAQAARDDALADALLRRTRAWGGW